MKVILHVNEKDRWNMAIGNIHNLLKLDPELVIEMLVHGEAIVNLEKKISKSLGIYDDLEELSKKGVKFAACNNTMKKMNIDKNEMCDFVTVVPAGVMELIEKQNEGYSYVKP